MPRSRWDDRPPEGGHYAHVHVYPQDDLSMQIWTIRRIEKGKYADIIAVAGNPLADIAEMQRVRFVMKGGYMVKNELTAR